MKKIFKATSPGGTSSGMSARRILLQRKGLPLFTLCLGFWGFSQTVVYFKYDEAGNQKYRGPSTGIGEGRNPGDFSDTTYKTAPSENSGIIDEKDF